MRDAPTRQPVRRRSRRRAALIVALAAAAAAVAPVGSAAPAGLVVSASSNRSTPAALDGSTLTGNAYVFVTGFSAARRVRYVLDGGAEVSRTSPFDYAGTRASGLARPLDTTALADGPHVMTAVVTRSGGSRIASLRATFTVANQVAPPPPPPPAVGSRRTLVPAYFFPGADWTRMCATLPPGAIAIMNPNSGPGATVDPAYVSAVASCRSRGAGVVGYVYTSYGARPSSAVRADVDAYFARYDVNGIFLDEASADATTQPYYAALYAYVHAKSAAPLTVVTNPGVAAASAWQLDGATADIVNVFEGTPSQFGGWTPPAWVLTASPSRLATIVYAAATQQSMQSACARAATLNLGWSYVTPDVLPNPFDLLPADPYWSAELAACGG